MQNVNDNLVLVADGSITAVEALSYLNGYINSTAADQIHNESATTTEPFRGGSFMHRYFSKMQTDNNVEKIFLGIAKVNNLDETGFTIVIVGLNGQGKPLKAHWYNYADRYPPHALTLTSCLENEKRFGPLLFPDIIEGMLQNVLSQNIANTLLTYRAFHEETNHGLINEGAAPTLFTGVIINKTMLAGLIGNTNVKKVAIMIGRENDTDGDYNIVIIGLAEAAGSGHYEICDQCYKFSANGTEDQLNKIIVGAYLSHGYGI